MKHASVLSGRPAYAVSVADAGDDSWAPNTGSQRQE